jgi:hypothetical protein
VGSQSLKNTAHAHLARILTQCDITPPVESIFDASMVLL